MLAWSISGWRKGAAALLVALYALCVVTPPAALAASGGTMDVHCLSNGQHDAAAPHGDGDSHPHSIPGDHDHGALAKCCGLFGVSALVPAFDAIVVHLARASDVAPPPAENLLGRNSERIDRPPRSLLSL